MSGSKRFVSNDKTPIEISSAIIELIAKTKAFVIERTENIREAAETLLKIEKKAAGNRRDY